MSETQDGADSNRSQRRRSSGSSGRRHRHARARRGGLRDTLRTATAHRVVLALVVVLGIAFAGLSIRAFRNNRILLADMYMIGPDRAETLYTFGAPSRVRATDGAAWTPVTAGTRINDYAIWGYTPSGGGGVDLKFDGSTGRVVRASCGDDMLNAAACATQFGVAIGDMEDRLVYQIGRPTRQAFQGPDKRMDYADLGVSYTLRELRVRRITLTPGTGGALDLAGRYLRFAIP